MYTHLHGNSLAAKGAKSPVAIIGIVNAAIRARLCIHKYHAVNIYSDFFHYRKWLGSKLAMNE
jgi:hypothetical protein